MKLASVIQAVAAVAALGFGANASAVPVTFDLAGGPESSVSINAGCSIGYCGATATLNPLLDSLSATLSAGQSWDFNFFSLNLWGIGTGSGTVSASLGFDSPTGAPNAEGSGSGSFWNAFGIFSGGSLTWQTQPGSFSLADGTAYEVLFHNLDGIQWGSNVNVRATVKLVSEATPVPEPGTLALFGLSLLGAGLAARRRQV